MYMYHISYTILNSNLHLTPGQSLLDSARRSTAAREKFTRCSLQSGGWKCAIVGVTWRGSV